MHTLCGKFENDVCLLTSNIRYTVYAHVCEKTHHLGDGGYLKRGRAQLLSAQRGQAWEEHVLLEVLEQYPVGALQVLVLLLVLHLQKDVVHVVHEEEDAVQLLVR